MKKIIRKKLQLDELGQNVSLPINCHIRYQNSCKSMLNKNTPSRYDFQEPNLLTEHNIKNGRKL